MSFQDKLTELKLKLNSATKQKLKKEAILLSLRNKEIGFREEVSITKEENEFLKGQVNELISQISQMKCQIAMIDVCKASEEAKINVHLSNLTQYKNGYDELFKKERDLLNQQNVQLKQREAEEEEIVRQKMAKNLEINEQQAKQAAVIEDECVSIERECSVLSKRNKAIMLKLRRKLLETEDIRRDLMKNQPNSLPCKMQE